MFQVSKAHYPGHPGDNSDIWTFEYDGKKFLQLDVHDGSGYKKQDYVLSWNTTSPALTIAAAIRSSNAWLSSKYEGVQALLEPDQARFSGPVHLGYIRSNEKVLALPDFLDLTVFSQNPDGWKYLRVVTQYVEYNFSDGQILIGGSHFAIGDIMKLLGKTLDTTLPAEDKKELRRNLDSILSAGVQRFKRLKA